MHSNWGFEQMPNFFFPFPTTFFSPPNNRQAGLQLCAKPLAIFQAPDYFSYLSGCQNLTVLLHWWLIDDVNLEETVPPAANFFKMFSSLIFKKFPSERFRKQSLWRAPPAWLFPRVSPCLQTTDGWGSCSSYPAHWLKLIPKFPTISECTAFSNSVISYTDMLKAQTDAGMLEHGFVEFLCSDYASFCYLPNKVTVFSLWSILFKCEVLHNLHSSAIIVAHGHHSVSAHS